MANNFSGKSAEQLVQIGTGVTTVITGVPNAYGVTQAQITALTTGDTDLNTAINGQASARNAAKAATQTKATKRKAVVTALTAISDTVYPNPLVTDQMLAAIGFAPRPTHGSPRIPLIPTNLVATPVANGTVRLKWDRAGNAPTVVFVIETSPNGTAWSFLRSTTRLSYVAPGFPPGQPAWFRVSATTSTTSSLPSLPVSVYAPGGQQVELKVA